MSDIKHTQDLLEACKATFGSLHDIGEAIVDGNTEEALTLICKAGESLQAAIAKAERNE